MIPSLRTEIEIARQREEYRASLEEDQMNRGFYEQQDLIDSYRRER